MGELGHFLIALKPLNAIAFFADFRGLVINLLMNFVIPTPLFLGFVIQNVWKPCANRLENVMKKLSFSINMEKKS